MIKRIIACSLFSLFFVGATFAQSTMTDQQVLEYVQKGVQQGKNQKIMAEELALKGVTKEQAERVKKMYDSASTHDYSRDNGSRLHITSNKREDNLINQDNPTEVASSEDISLTTSKVFGQDIFNNKNLNFAPNENLATPRNYKLGPGDEVIIDIFGANQTTMRSVISPEGSINVDVLGPLYLSGMTIDEANGFLKKKLGAIYAGLGRDGSRSDIRLSLGQIRSIQINVLGEVQKPGTYEVSSFSTVFHALYKAGGIKDQGSLRNIKVVRYGRTVAQIDVYDFLMNGNRRNDIRLEEGDVILVPTYSNLVNIKGKVKRPMYFEMKNGESFKKLLDYAGGFGQSAYTNSVTIVRQNGKEFTVETLDKIDFENFKMKDGDEVEVSGLLSRFENRIEIKGAVYRTGIFQLSDKINTVRKLIYKADGLLPEAFTSRAILHRERPDRSLEVLPVDVESIMKGTSPDIELRNNDILFIPSIYDLKDRGTLSIYGEVAAPGTFPYADNTTLEDLILQAGGMLESASTARIDVSRRVKDSGANVADNKLGELFSFSLKDGFVVEGEPGFVLQPYDQVYVRRSPSYHVQQNVIVNGEVNFTGTFAMTDKNERMSDLVKKAGGVTKFAYVKGARLERTINNAERRKMQDVLNSLKQGNDSISTEQLDFGNTYYVGIELDKALEQPGSQYDLVLREGDKLLIPTYTNTVSISGAVTSPNTITYIPKLKVRDYIEEAGGYSQNAKKSRAYIVYMNGHINKAKRNSKVEPGSQIIVPVRQRNPNNLQNILGIATTSASLATMIASIANILK